MTKKTTMNKAINNKINIAKKREGALMLMVLFLLTLLILFVTSLYALSIMNVKESVIYHEKNQAYLVAKSGAETVIDQLALLDTTELENKFALENPQTIIGEIAGGKYKAKLMKYGKQIMIDVDAEYKRTESEALVQLSDVNRYGVLYMKNGNLNISNSGEAQKTKITGDIVQYGGSRTSCLSGSMEFKGNMYTQRPVDIRATGNMQLGSIYTTNKLNVSTNSNSEIDFNGFYTSYGTRGNIFSIGQNSKIIGNEIQRGDNNIQDAPKGLFVRTARNIITMRYTDEFGYPNGFPEPKIANEPGLFYADEMPNKPYEDEGIEIPIPNISLEKYNDEVDVKASIIEMSDVGLFKDKLINIENDLKDTRTLDFQGIDIRGIKVTKDSNQLLNIKGVNIVGGDVDIQGKVCLHTGNKEQKISEVNLSDGAKWYAKYGTDIEIKQNFKATGKGSQLIHNNEKNVSGDDHLGRLYIGSELKLLNSARLTDKGAVIVGGSITLNEVNANEDDRVQLKIDELKGKSISSHSADIYLRGNIDIENKISIKNTNILPRQGERGIITAEKFQMSGGHIDMRGMKISRDYEESFLIKENANVELEEDCVTQRSKIEENAYLSANVFWAESLEHKGNMKVKQVCIDGSGYYNKLDCKSGSYIKTNSIVTNNLSMTGNSYIKAAAITLVKDLTMTDNSEIDMLIYEDLTDINSKNSYSNIIWMDKE